MQTSFETAKTYLDYGLSVLPARRKDKCPAVRSWKAYQERLPTQSEVGAWFANAPDAVCIVTGMASGNLEIIDFDNGGELFEPWEKLVKESAKGLFDRLVIEQTPSGGWHAVYRCERAVDGNMKLAQGQRNGKLTTLIETRGHGGLFLCAPTENYELVQGDFSAIPMLSKDQRDILLSSARQLNEHWVSADPAPITKTQSSGLLPGEDFNQCGDVKALLEKYGWKYLYNKNDNDYYRRPGKNSGSCSASLKDRTFFVFSSNAAPFEAWKSYSPFAVFAQLECYGDYSFAAGELASQGYGEPLPEPDMRDVDISGIVKAAVQKPASDELVDPGALPEHLLSVPGFINNVTEYTMRTAPYPNRTLAFSGALTLLSFLLARRVRDCADVRSNVYLVALANSGAGKDHPRKVNMNIAYEIGLHNHFGDAFASGEGLQDVMAHYNYMLFQTDEIDGLLKTINGFTDARHEYLMSTMLKMYSAANSIYKARAKAGTGESTSIVNPSLTLYGTAVPKYCYESLNERMLSNGFFARLLIFESETRGEGQEPNLMPVPSEIISAANYWANFNSSPNSRGNLRNEFPAPFIIPAAPKAVPLYQKIRRSAEDCYHKAEKIKDTAGMSVWARAYEKVRKLALIYAASANQQNPQITSEAVSWAWEVVRHQTLKMLFMARMHVAENPFHAMCLKMEQKLASLPDRAATRSDILRHLKCKAGELDEVVESLLQQERIAKVEITTKTKPAAGFKLIA
jgi:hypothetical protein